MRSGKEKNLFEGGTLLVPLKATEFARSLASTFVVGNMPLREEPSDAKYKDAVMGFQGFIPGWADRSSEGDPLVLLEVPQTGDEVETNVPGCYFFKSPPRITAVCSASFENSDLMQDFAATYLSFPDVPESLVELKVSEFRRAEEALLGEEELDVSSLAPQTGIKESVDALAGWSRVLVENFFSGAFDQEISEILSRNCNDGESSWTWERLATNALEGLDQKASDADKVIWVAVVSLLLKHRLERGFDRRAVLEELQAELSKKDKLDEVLERWITVSRDIATARREMAPLSDEGSIGQRAALAILVAQDPRGIDGLSAGTKVAFLSKLFAGAFQGMSRAAGEQKNDCAQLDVTLEIAERIVAGQAAELKLGSRTYDSDLRSSDEIVLNGAVVGRRVSEPAPHRIMLRARAMEAGQKILPEEKTGRLRVVSREADKAEIYVEDESGSIKSNPLVRFWTPLLKVTSRTPSAAKTRELLEKSWETGCAVGISEVDGVKMLCCYFVVLTNTLDREEFEHHVGALQAFAESYSGLNKRAKKS
ncbi:MAG: hypothetical protein JXR14_02425 [Paracoccaceae bacterium]